MIYISYRVYSWGWGVHGQLGHGSIEDELEPRKILGLQRINVVTISGGQGHSLVCSKQVNRLFYYFEIFHL